MHLQIYIWCHLLAAATRAVTSTSDKTVRESPTKEVTPMSNTHGFPVMPQLGECAFSLVPDHNPASNFGFRTACVQNSKRMSWRRLCLATASHPDQVKAYGSQFGLNLSSMKCSLAWRVSWLLLATGGSICAHCPDKALDVRWDCIKSLKKQHREKT